MSAMEIVWLQPSIDYLAGEISKTHEGMTVVVNQEEWEIFEKMTLQMFVITLLELTKNVQLEKYTKPRRESKKKFSARISSKKNPMSQLSNDYGKLKKTP